MLGTLTLKIVAVQPVVRAIGGTLHLAVAGACLIAAVRGHVRRRFWSILCVLQVGIAVDSALGLRHAIGDLGRAYFRAHGWYGQRSVPQALISIIGVLLVGIAAGGMLWRLGRDGSAHNRACQLAAAGTGLSLAMMVLSAVSLHAVEQALGWPLRWLNAGVILRGAGAAMVLAGAWAFLRAPSAQRLSTIPSAHKKTPGDIPGV